MAAVLFSEKKVRQYVDGVNFRKRLTGILPNFTAWWSFSTLFLEFDLRKEGANYLKTKLPVFK